MPDLKVDFYVIEEAAPTARLKLACRLAEKAYLAGQRVLIWHTNEQELRAFDDLLWSFGDRSFVPHEWLAAPAGSTALAVNGDRSEAPVVLSAAVPPTAEVDVLINLAPEVPVCIRHSARVMEIIDGDATRRQAGRARFKAYRDMGLTPASHTLRSEQL